MNASIVDLRYKMSEVLDALARRERVTIFYHGKVKGVIVPVEERSKSKASKHPFFGMASGEKKAVEQVMEELRGGAIVIFDTDIFIWVQRENKKAAALIDGTEERYLSVQSYMELLQCARDKGQQRLVKQFVSDLGFIVLPLSENIGGNVNNFV